MNGKFLFLCLFIFKNFHAYLLLKTFYAYLCKKKFMLIYLKKKFMLICLKKFFMLIPQYEGPFSHFRKGWAQKILVLAQVF